MYMLGLKKFRCFRLQSGEKVATGAPFFKYFFLFHDMPRITEQLINKKAQLTQRERATAVHV